MTATSWAAQRELHLKEWLEQGRRLGVLGRGVAWWIGDWLRYGNERYGERYARASRATGYDAQSLMNMVYVASRFEPAKRREALSWSHHAEVAPLDPEDRDSWLDLAETQRLSVRSLRVELRAFRRQRPLRAAAAHRDTGRALARPAPAPPPDERPRIVCPNCRHVIAEQES
jgi:hypothetical protein